MKYIVIPGVTLFLLSALIACKPNGEESGGIRAGTETSESGTSSTESSSLKDVRDTAGMREDYTNTNRVIWQKPEMVMDFMGDITNKTIADIGAGTGFFAFRIARKAKKVIAVDIFPQMIEYLDSAKVMELPEDLQPKLEARLALPNDPKLNPEEVDMVVIVNTYMYIPQRVDYLKKIREGLAENGKLLILDFKKKRTPIGPPSDIRIPLFVVENELDEAGFSKISSNDTALDYQYIIVAEK